MSVLRVPGNWRSVFRAWVLILFPVLAVCFILGVGVVEAQVAERQVQVLTGRITQDSRIVYTLPDLKAEQTLYVRVENTSGNLDPVVMLLEEDADIDVLSAEAVEELKKAVSEGRDPMITLPEIYDRYALVWNDDYAGDSTAAFEFMVPDDAESSSYQLMVFGATGLDSFGEYEMVVGLEAPKVLDGTALPTGDNFVFLNLTSSNMEAAAKEVKGVITEEQPQTTVTLRDLNAGDTIYAYVEATTGDLAPVLVLLNFNNKPLRSDNITAESSKASLQYQLERDVSNYKISVQSFEVDGQISTGEYRLLVGVNAPQILSGKSETNGESPLVEPIEVRIGSKLQQITNIDQQAERFSAVAQLNLEWQDPALAYNPDSCHCDFMTYTGDGFSKFADANEILWPEFTFFNQQGNLWVQNRDVVVFPDGRAYYQERFTSDFQAPLFDFVRFPFDEQQLYIQVVSTASERFFTYTDPEELSTIGDQLGEEEWYIFSSSSQITSEDEHASYWLTFNIRRHLNFYIYRIFVPIGLVILISWFTFWLKDYDKRVDVSSANLLLFVAYNFTIGNELPRLGYLTFMDAALIGAFVVSTLVVLFNVVLRRLESEGRVELAYRIDQPMIWLYPLLYMIGAFIAFWRFLY